VLRLKFKKQPASIKLLVFTTHQTGAARALLLFKPPSGMAISCFALPGFAAKPHPVPHRRSYELS
jgi:hypothetical protein